MKPIYKPKGAAGEYGDYALNIYTGCNHGCYYCYSRSMHERFHPDTRFDDVQVRPGLLDALAVQLASGAYKGKMIHLCFTCDPYPADVDTTATREVIKMLKLAGAHVQVLTKGGHRAERDFDLLDGEDWFGVTYAGYPDGALFHSPAAEPNASCTSERLTSLRRAFQAGVKTWISFEPVLNAIDVLNFLELAPHCVSRYKIGKLNYHQSIIDWKKFGQTAERICHNNRLDYYIKADLRKEMER